MEWGMARFKKAAALLLTMSMALAAPELLKPTAQKKKSLNALKEECAELCEKALDATRSLQRKLLDCDEKTVTVFKRIVEDELSREELELSIKQLRNTIEACSLPKL